MSDYYQFRDEKGTPIDYYQLVNDNNELCEEIERLNNIINELALLFDDYNEFNKILEKYNYELKGSDKNV